MCVCVCVCVCVCERCWYLGFATSHQRPREGDVAAGGDVSIGGWQLVGGGFGAGAGLARQTGLVHRQVARLRRTNTEEALNTDQ